jgi:predicted membrane-bound spermidine synthase
MNHSAKLRPLLAATASSGAAALMYETLWTRSLAIALGSTVQAAAAVFAAFLVGLALGAGLCGTIIDRTRRVVVIYAVIEVGIALAAVGTGFLLYHMRESLSATLGQSIGVAGMLRAFGITLALVLLPTLLMGATFPALLAASRRLGAGAVEMTRLYAVNTLGAALGTLACGWIIIRVLGVTNSLLVAGGLNIVSALLCLLAVRQESDTTPADVAPCPAPTGAGSARASSQTLLLATAVLSGAAVLSLEVVWTRLASFTLGNRCFAFSTFLAWVLVWLAAGSWLAGRLVHRFAGRSSLLLAVLLLAGAAGIGSSISLVNAWIVSPGNLVQVFPHSPAVVVLVRVLGIGLLMALFLLPLGCLFPTGLACLRTIETRTGNAAGRYYLWNTLGSVTGSLMTGFVAIPAIGSFASAVTMAALCSLAALTVFLGLARKSQNRRVAAVGGLAAVAMLVIVPLVVPAQLRSIRAGERALTRVEDEWGVFQVTELADGRLRVTNNRTELVFLAGDFSTSYVQQMQGHLASFMRPQARTALVLGSGYGITAGALAANPGLQSIDAVEIVPAMVAAADLFEPYNLSYHRQPRVRVFVDDGRHFLARSQRKYDIISINVSDPHLPGGSSLFHADFYKVVKRHLNSGGVVVQHAFGSDAKVVLSTLRHSFRHLRLFPAYHNGYNVVAADDPLLPSQAEVARLASVPSLRDVLAGIGILPPIDPWAIVSRGRTPSQLPALFDSTLLATDDRPILEFSQAGDPLLWFSSNE